VGTQILAPNLLPKPTLWAKNTEGRPEGQALTPAPIKKPLDPQKGPPFFPLGNNLGQTPCLQRTHPFGPRLPEGKALKANPYPPAAHLGGLWTPQKGDPPLYSPLGEPRVPLAPNPLPPKGPPSLARNNRRERPLKAQPLPPGATLRKPLDPQKFSAPNSPWGTRVLWANPLASKRTPPLGRITKGA